MSSYVLTRHDREYLLSELDECLIELEYRLEEREEILENIDCGDNVTFAQDIQDWMPEALEELQVNRLRDRF